jgi:hypothetical protein
VAVFVAQLGFLRHFLGYREYLAPAFGGRFAQLGQSLDKLDAGSCGVQRQKNHDCSFFVYLREAGDEIDEQAFRIRPSIVQLAGEQQYLLETRDRFVHRHRSRMIALAAARSLELAVSASMAFIFLLMTEGYIFRFTTKISSLLELKACEEV